MPKVTLTKAGSKKPRLSISAPKAKDPLEGVQASNDATREALSKLGIKDPTEKKGATLLDKVFGVLDTAGAGTRALAYNAVSDEDVNPLEEMGKSLRGEARIEGSDILEKFGVQNKWALTIGGIALDILLDPTTYLTFGYGGAAKAGATSLLDDAARNADDLFKLAQKAGVELSDEFAEGLVKGTASVHDLAPDLTRKLASAAREMAGLGLKSADKGGMKLFGQTIAPVQQGLEKATYAAKDVFRKIPGTKTLEAAFAHGGNSALTGVFREGNELVNASLKRMLQRYSAKTANAIDEGAKIAKEIEKLVPDANMRNLVTIGIGRQFDQGDNLIKLDSAFEAVKDSFDKGDKELADAAIDNLVRLRSDLLDPEAVAKTIRQYMPDVDEDTVTQAKKAAETIRSTFEGNMAKMRAEGVEVKSLFGEGSGSSGYMPGMAPFSQSKGEQKALGQTLETIGVDPADLSLPKRTAFDSAGLRVKAQKSKEYMNAERRMIDGGLMTELDAARLAGAKTASDYRNIARQDFATEMSQVFGDVEPDAIKDFIGKFNKAFTSDEATQGFMKAYDKALNMWKKTATIWNVGFHMRNKTSNAWLLWSENILDADAWAKAPMLLTGHGSIDVGKLGVMNADELLELASKNRIAVKMSEITELVGKEAVGSPTGALTKIGGKATELIENSDRLAGFIAALRKGLDPEAAGELVNRALYNYAPEAYTAFERNFMKRIIPFYAWMKNNTPHMVEVLFKSPGKITPFGHMQEVGQAVNPIDESVMPDWLRDLQPISLPLQDKGNPLLLNIDMPYKGLNLLDLWRNGELDIKDLTSSISPLIRTPFEILIAKKDLYYGSELTGVKKRVPGYIEQFDDLVEKTPLAAPWTAVKEALGIYELEDKETGSPYLVMDERAVKFLRDFNPWLNNVGKFMSDQPRQKYDRISMTTGVKPVLYDEEQFGRQQTYNDSAQLQELRAILKSAGMDMTKPEKKKTISLLGKR